MLVYALASESYNSSIPRHRDHNDPRIWDSENAVLVNVQLLNSLDFSRVTGLRPPPTPITRQQYREEGIPWYKIYEEDVTTADTMIGQKVFKNLKTIEEVQPNEGDETRELIVTLPVSNFGRPCPSFRRRYGR